MKKLFIIPCVALLTSLYPQKSFSASYEERAQHVIDYWSADEKYRQPKRYVYRAMALYEKNDLTQAKKFLDRVLNANYEGKKQTGAFIMMGLSHILHKYADKISEEDTNKALKLIGTFDPTGGKTENHRIMYYSAVLTLLDTFPSMEWNGYTRQELRNKAEKFIVKESNLILTKGINNICFVA